MKVTFREFTAVHLSCEVCDAEIVVHDEDEEIECQECGARYEVDRDADQAAGRDETSLTLISRGDEDLAFFLADRRVDEERERDPEDIW